MTNLTDDNNDKNKFFDNINGSLPEISSTNSPSSNLLTQMIFDNFICIKNTTSVDNQE